LPIDCQAATNSTKQVLMARAPKQKIVSKFFFPDNEKPKAKEQQAHLAELSLQNNSL